MEAIKEQSASTPATSTVSKLRYPLRSSTKSKAEKSPAVPEIPTTSAARRGRSISSVSKSVNVLDLSGKDKDKDKSARPPRRLSIPTKSAASPHPRSVGGVTPISEARSRKPASSQMKSDTPLSDVSKSSSRKKFSALSSASYWITQIKLSESASKHLISIGFFKLALEAGCEPLQRMRDELKTYARRHNLLELGEPAKEVLGDYNILEDVEQLQASETSSQVVESSDGESNASSTRAGSLKPKSLNTENIRSSSIKQTGKKEVIQKGMSTGRNRTPVNRSSNNINSVNETSMQKKTQRPAKRDTKRESGKKIKNSEVKSSSESGSADHSADEIQQEDKENMVEAPVSEETSLTA